MGIHNAMAREFVDRECVLVTPLHKMINRLKEMARGAKRHGSCGLGQPCYPSLRTPLLLSP